MRFVLHRQQGQKVGGGISECPRDEILGSHEMTSQKCGTNFTQTESLKRKKDKISFKSTFWSVQEHRIKVNQAIFF